jgi:hypothetical protein
VLQPQPCQRGAGQPIKRFAAGVATVALQAISDTMAAELVRFAVGTFAALAGDLVDQRGNPVAIDQLRHEAAHGEALDLIAASQSPEQGLEMRGPMINHRFNCGHAALQSDWSSRFDLTSSIWFGYDSTGNGESDRHRGRPLGRSPATPPGMRVRTGRFE